jgi:lipoprotein NlpI
MGIEDFDKALSISPELHVAHFNKAMVFFVYEHYSAAIRSFNDAIEKNPSYGEAYTRRGMAKINDGSYSLASACTDFESGQSFDDPLAADYIKEYCKSLH